MAGAIQVLHNLNEGGTSCQIPLICQCSGLFLERLKLAAWDQSTINLTEGMVKLPVKGWREGASRS